MDLLSHVIFDIASVHWVIFTKLTISINANKNRKGIKVSLQFLYKTEFNFFILSHKLVIIPTS